MKSIKSEKFVDLSKMCSIKIGGKAKSVYFPTSEDQVRLLLIEALEKNKRFFPIGIGSNTVFSDGIIDLFFVSTRFLKKCRSRSKF